MNTTTSTQVSTKLNKTFYDRQLLESAKTRFVFTKYGQKRNLPRHNGKQVEFRRWELFDPNIALSGLEEGVTPAGQDLTQSSVTADIHQYGAYVEVSDMLDMTGYDNVINDSVELLGEQLGTVVEWVKVRRYLADTDENGHSIWQCFSTCKNLIHYLPALCYDSKNVEDARDGDDHAPEALRYGLYSRPGRSVLPSEKPKARYDPLSVDEPQGGSFMEV